MATALAGGVAAVVLALVGGSGAPGSQPLKAHGRTPASTGSPVLAACAPTARHVAPDGKPDRSLLSILPILRRPARPSDALPAGVLGGLPFRRDVLVRYIRRARVIGTTNYWLFPVVFGCAPRTEFVAEWVAGSAAASSGGGLGNAGQIEQGHAYGTQSGIAVPTGRTEVDMLVPDGVASVTFAYPAGGVGGFGGGNAPAFVTTTRVTDNLVVIDVPRANSRITTPMTMTWRAADGRRIATFARL